MKRIIICCDGTWNRPDQVSGGKVCPTNVAHIASAIDGKDADGMLQLVYYQKGVGAGEHSRLLGLFGRGLSRNILDAYSFLIKHYAPGDELFLFGYSRGAYTVRSLVGLIGNSGLLRREHADHIHDAYRLYRRRDPAARPREKEAQLFRRTYTYEAMGHVVRTQCLGVWDTVGQLGVPIGLLGRLTRRIFKLEFHDVELSSTVDHGFHALAIDEKRAHFEPTLWRQPVSEPPQHIEQRWFAGSHSNVGGGYPDARPSNIAFAWMVERASECGLAFRDEYLAREIDLTALGDLRESRTGWQRLLPARIRKVCQPHDDELTYEAVHPSVIQRVIYDDRYRPKNVPAHMLHIPDEAEEERVSV